MKTIKRQTLFIVIVMVMAIATLTACGRGDMDAELAPNMTDNPTSVVDDPSHTPDDPTPVPDDLNDNIVLNLPLTIINTTITDNLFINTDGYAIKRSLGGDDIVLSNVRSIASDGSTHFFIRYDNSLWAMGNNGNGQVGDGTNENRDEPVQILENVANVYVNVGRVFAVTMDGTLYRWGTDLQSLLSPSIHAPIKIFDDVVAFHSVYVPVGVGSIDAYALRSDGSLWKLEEHTTEVFDNVLHVGDGGDIRATRQGVPTTVGRWIAVIRGDNSLWKIGGENEKIFEDVKSFHIECESIRFVVHRSYFVVGLDGTLWGWGTNNNGQLGDGTRTNRDDPTKILDNIDSVLFISHEPGFGHQALDNDGNLWHWSGNDPIPSILHENIVAHYGNYLLDANGVLYRNTQAGLFQDRENVMLPSETVVN